MLARDIVALAVDAQGTLFVATADGVVAVVEGGRLRPLGGAPERLRAAALAPRPGSGVYVADSMACRLLVVDADGRWAVVAGAPQPPALDARPRAADGPADAALLRTPSAIAAAGTCVLWFEHDAIASVRELDGGTVRTVTLDTPAHVTAASGAADGGVYLADGTVPCLYRRSADGAVARVAGVPGAAGADDGPAEVARFASIVAITATAFGCVVLDGGRLRRVDARGYVSTVAGDRFDGARAIAASPDGAVVVADAGRGTIRRVDPDGRPTTVAADGPAVIDEGSARRLAREFADALVDGDVVRGWAVAEVLLDEQTRRGGRRPNRALHPVSPASARVGRALALEWCASRDGRRARLGAYCLWLIRSEECRDAPASDATQLVRAFERDLEAGLLEDARRRADVVRIAFGDLVRRRDRIAVAAAYRATDAARRAADLLASADPAARALAVEALRQSRDIRFTAALAAIALEGGRDGERALVALRELWDAPAYVADQEAELRASLRFGRTVVDRLLAERGEEALGRLGAARYRRVVAGRP